MSKAYVVLDSGFLIATIANKDAFHDSAVFLFEELKVRKDYVVLVVPPLVMYEVIVSLRRKGIRGEHVESILMRFINLQYVSVLVLSEMSAFKHAKNSLTISDQTSALRTHDFMIFCIGVEFDATIVTFDYKMLSKCKTSYKSIYFPSGIHGAIDETADVLTEIDAKIGEDVNSDSYTPLKTVPF